MPKAAVNQGWQIGKETTPGLAVAANRKLMAYTVEPAPAIETAQFTGSGYKVPTVTQMISERMGASLEGLLDYRNIIYLLASMFGSVTPVQPDATNAPLVYKWTWTFDGKSKITPVTYTTEWGEAGAGNASKFTYGVVTGMEWEIGRADENTISADLIGQELMTGQTLTASPTEVDVEPVDGDHWDAFMADTGAGLTSSPTQLTELYAAKLSISDLFAPAFPLNSAEPSFTAVYESEEQEFELEATLGADATAAAMLTDTARNSKKKFFRFKATGDIIQGTLPFSITVDMCTVVKDADAFQSDDGLYVLPVTYALAYDKTWGKAMVIEVQTDVSAL